MVSSVLGIVHNYQHFWLNETFSFMGGWVNPPVSLKKMSTCTAHANTSMAGGTACAAVAKEHLSSSANAKPMLRLKFLIHTS